MSRTCGNCRWWYGSFGYTGECRIRSQRDIVVKKDWELCGEWANAATTPEQDDQREMVRRFAVAIIQGVMAHPSLKANSQEVWALAQGMADAEPDLVTKSDS